MMPSGWYACCEGVFMMGWLHFNSTVSPLLTRVNSEIHCESVIQQGWRCTPQPWSSEFGEAAECHNPVSLKICTWRPQSSRFADTLAGRDGASLKMLIEALIEWVWSYSLGGYDAGSLEIHLEAVMERVWRYTGRSWLRKIVVLGGSLSGGSSSGGRGNSSWDCIHWLTCNCGNVEDWVQHGLLTDLKVAGSGRQSILGWCSMPCMKSSVYAVIGVCCTWCQLLIMEWRDTEGWLNFVFLGDGRGENEYVRDDRRWRKSSWETGTLRICVQVNIPFPIL